MTEILEKEVVEPSKPLKSAKSIQLIDWNLKSRVLNCVFRYISFTDGKENLRKISNIECKVLSSKTKIPIYKVRNILNKFLDDLTHFKEFLRSGLLTYSISDQARKVKIYLHKVHRLAPIFDYKRGRENARRLKLKLDQLFFWPQVMTQVAVVIFITDFLDKRWNDNKILQTNLRTLCDCSAYAFHRTRNRIGLTTRALEKLKY
ncbi:MAG: hypothetical protein ACFE9T_01030 [Promethearchaeota archaeon]